MRMRSAGAGRGETNLNDGREVFASRAELALLLGPGLHLFAIDVVEFGEVVLDRLQRYAAVALSVELGGGEGVPLGVNLGEAGGSQRRSQRAR